jgi:hypothetical protein
MEWNSAEDMFLRSCVKTFTYCEGNFPNTTVALNGFPLISIATHSCAAL